MFRRNRNANFHFEQLLVAPSRADGDRDVAEEGWTGWWCWWCGRGEDREELRDWVSEGGEVGEGDGA